MKKKNRKIVELNRSEMAIEYGENTLLDDYKVALSHEKQVKELIKELEEDNKRIRELYYSVDVQVANVLSRTFIELVKMFLRRLIECKKNEKDATHIISSNTNAI